MLKRRIIGSITLKNNWVVQSISFNKYLPIGQLKYSVNILDRWGVDEIIVFDIDASKLGYSPNFKLYKESTKNINVPLTVGGGIRDVSDMINALQSGADKICLNHSILENTQIIFKGSKTLGRQCIVVSIDVVNNGKRYEVFDHIKKKSTGLSPLELSKKAVDLGAGELVVRSIHNDGMKNGYEIELISEISDNVSVPVIAAGGYGNPIHLLDCFNNTNISACAIGNSLNYTEHSIGMIKSYLSERNSEIRHETSFKYSNNVINKNGRITKYDDDYLEKLIFEKFPKVKI